MNFKNITLNICIAALMAVATISSCSEAAEKKAAINDYEKGKASMLQLEKDNPQQFLGVINTFKRNMVGQSVIKGKIINSAKVANYTNVILNLKFYSKTGALLEEDVETIYERIEAGKTQVFKSKYFTPKGTATVTVRVESATVAK